MSYLEPSKRASRRRIVTTLAVLAVIAGAGIAVNVSVLAGVVILGAVLLAGLMRAWCRRTNRQ